jgi:hypothetical protein
LINNEICSLATNDIATLSSCGGNPVYKQDVGINLFPSVLAVIFPIEVNVEHGQDNELLLDCWNSYLRYVGSQKTGLQLGTTDTLMVAIRGYLSNNNKLNDQLNK